MVLTVKTRSGRVSKAPVRLELFEDVEDDYKQDEYDTDEDLLNSDDEDFLSDDDIENDESDEDADDNGNLKGFVVDDTDEDEDYSEEEEEEEEISE
jgi:hypothetical protein|tara:strand:+ start:6337 stop:6624 length:288 start_codon:yes stop_codon:yes gene_type:complete